MSITLEQAMKIGELAGDAIDAAFGIDAGTVTYQEFMNTAEIFGKYIKTLIDEKSDSDIKLDNLRTYFSQPVAPDGFHLNGFPTIIDQLADGFDEEAAAVLKTNLK